MQTNLNFKTQIFRFFVTIAIGIVIILAWIFFQIRKNSSAKPQQRPPSLVSVAKVETKDTHLFVKSVGFCIPLESVKIVPQVTGELKSIHFKQGNFVKKGDLLFSIDSRIYKSVLAKAEAQLIIDRSKLELAEAKKNRSRALLSDKFISQQEFDICEANVKEAQGLIKSDLAAIELAKINLENCEITSPINGKTSKFLIDVGNIVNTQSVLTTVQSISDMYVEFSLPDSDFLSVVKFQNASKNPLIGEITTIDSNDSSENKVDCNLIFIDNKIEKNSATGTIRLKMDNSQMSFWPGQAVNIRILLQKIEKAVFAPEEAVQISQEGNFVYVLKPDQTVEYRKIRLGQQQKNMCLIEEGLNFDEIVVTQGQMMIAPGSKVSVISKKF